MFCYLGDVMEGDVVIW